MDKTQETVEEVVQKTTEPKAKDVKVHEVDGYRFNYVTMPNKPLSWVQKLERNYASK